MQQQRNSMSALTIHATHPILWREHTKTTLSLALILALALSLGFTGCGDGSHKHPPNAPNDGDDDPGVAGTLDASFGGGVGIVTTPIDHMAFAMAIQNDGKILVAGGGNSGQAATVVRYNTDGSLDTDFGTGGIAALPAGSNELSIANDLAIDGDGKIVVAGIGSNGGFFRVAAARLNSDGSLDTSFGSSGIFYSPFTSNGSYGAQGVAIQDDGKIVVTGKSYRGPVGSWDNYAASVARYNTDGSLDTAGFGNPDGYIIDADLDDPQAMALQNGKIVVAGGALVGSCYQFAMLRFNADGSLDGTFGDTGLVTTPVGEAAANAEAYSIALADDGIVLGGHVSIYPDAWMALARYTADGSLDTTFGSPDGYVLTEIGTSPYPYGLAIDDDGKIVAAGGNGSSPSEYFVARYLP